MLSVWIIKKKTLKNSLIILLIISLMSLLLYQTYKVLYSYLKPVQKRWRYFTFIRFSSYASTPQWITWPGLLYLGYDLRNSHFINVDMNLSEDKK